MEYKKLLTVSIAAYNVASCLEQTLESLLVTKNAGRLEVLIVNDGSGDETPSIAGKYVEKYPEVFFLIDKENGGHGSTINTGIERAEGKYFKVLDGDDWFDTEGLAELLERLEETDADLVLTDRVNVYETRRESVTFGDRIPRCQRCLFEDLNGPISITLSAICVKTDLMRKSGLRCLERCYYEDMEFDVYSIAVSNSYIYYPIALYQYRLGGEGQSIAPSNLQKNIHMSRKVAKTIDAFYSANRETFSRGQRLCILERAGLIHAQVISTSVKGVPNEEYRRELTGFIAEIESEDIRENLKKRNQYIRLLCNFPGTYKVIAGLYQFVKHVK